MKKRLLLVLLAISLIFISSCAQQEAAKVEKVQEPFAPEDYQKPLPSASQSQGLGNLCNSEQECIAFCKIYRGECETYCQGNTENPICQKLVAAGLIEQNENGSTPITPPESNATTVAESPKVEQKITIIAQNLEIPWSLVFLPSGELLFTERDGSVKMLKNGNVIDIAKIETIVHGEGGLLGSAIDPDFENNNFIYFYYTYKEGSSDRPFNKVSRFVYDQNKNELSDQTVILDEIPGLGGHNGGRIKFGPDSKMYITSGDAELSHTTQDLDSLAGKILRINKDGSIPSDNPFPGSPVYSYGHRNPQGLAWHAATNKLYASEHGPIGNDEINLIMAGKNYFWPTKQCTDKDAPAIVCFSEFTLAPRGMTFYKNDLYVSGLRGAQLRKISFDENANTVISQEIFLENYGRIRDVIVGPDNYLYVSTSNRDGRGDPSERDDLILRIKPD